MTGYNESILNKVFMDLRHPRKIRKLFILNKNAADAKFQFQIS